MTISLGGAEIAVVPAVYHADIEKAGLRIASLDGLKAVITVAHLERATRQLDAAGHVAALAAAYMLEAARRSPAERWAVR